MSEEVSPTIEIILDLCIERDVALSVVLQAIDMNASEIDFIACNYPITEILAEKLAKFAHTKEFWLNHDALYQTQLDK